MSRLQGLVIWPKAVPFRRDDPDLAERGGVGTLRSGLLPYGRDPDRPIQQDVTLCPPAAHAGVWAGDPTARDQCEMCRRMMDLPTFQAHAAGCIEANPSHPFALAVIATLRRQLHRDERAKRRAERQEQAARRRDGG